MSKVTTLEASDHYFDNHGMTNTFEEKKICCLNRQMGKEYHDVYCNLSFLKSGGSGLSFGNGNVFKL